MTIDSITPVSIAINLAAANWRRICMMAGYSNTDADTLTPGIVAHALKSRGFTLAAEFENNFMPDCDGNGGGWCDCPECED